MEQSLPAFTLTEHSAKLVGFKPLKKVESKTKKESQNDEGSLKCQVTFEVKTHDEDLLRCFDNKNIYSLLLDNSTIPSISFNTTKMNYAISINDSLNLERADLSGFKVSVHNSKEDGNYIKIVFKAKFCVEKNTLAILSEYWKENVTLDIEPSDHDEA